MKHGTRLAAAALAAALILPLGPAARAAGAEAAARQEDLEFLYSALKEGHPDLFAVTPEEAFETKKAEIEARLAGESQTQFVLDLQSLTALAGDSHTTLSLRFDEARYYPFELDRCGGDWILVRSGREEDLGLRVTAAAGLPMEEFCRRFQALASADNGVKLARQVKYTCYVAEILEYLGLAEPGAPVALTLEGPDGAEIQRTYAPTAAEDYPQAAPFRLEAEQAAPTAYDRDRAYFALPLGRDTYYIQYNRCREDPELPMEDFAGQVAAELEEGTYTQVLLDLRNNGGGSDGVIVPLLLVLREAMDQDGLRLFGLIGETTFSSALINAVEIREMGGVLAGSPTSGSVDHFGAVRSVKLPNTGLTLGCSSKYIAVDSLLEAGIPYGVESLRPDIPVDQTLADRLAGRDTLVDFLLAEGSACALPEEADLPLTRGRLVWLLWQGAGCPAAGAESAFRDVMPFAYYAAAVRWAEEEGVAAGVTPQRFQPARPVTWQEAAVLIARFAAWRGVQPPETGTPPEGTAPWAARAAAQLEAWGLTAEEAPFRPHDTLTRAGGRALAEGALALPAD